MNHHVVEKSKLRNYVMQLISEKIMKLEKFIHFTLEASQEIKKTPKYDSIREEMQNEMYHLEKQLFELKSLQQSMSKVINIPQRKAQLGSVVITNKARFYIAVSLGEFFYEGDRFYAISPESPIAQIMWNKQEGDEFELNAIHQKIEEIL